MKKELKNGQGFICKSLEEKKRIWQRLTNAGYRMYSSYDYCDKDYPHIVFSMDELGGNFCGGFSENITDPLNESEFFGENEWTPKAGEWVDASNDGVNWIGKKQYLCSIDDVHLCVMFEKTNKEEGLFSKFKHIRQVPPIPEMTIAEAEQKFKIKIKQP
jgi:hypothetical protein